MDLAAQTFPKVVSNAALATDHTPARAALPGAAGRADRLVHSQDDVRHPGLVDCGRQPVSTAGAANTLDQTALAQPGEELLEIGQRDFLSLGDLGVAALFGGGEAMTLPVLLYAELAAYRMDRAAAAMIALVAVTAALFVGLERAIGGRHG